MKILEISSQERFEGLDSSGFLTFPNRYICSLCGYGVYCDEKSLNERAGHYFGFQPIEKGGQFWKVTQFKRSVSKLKDEFIPIFENIINDNFKSHRDRFSFVMDFHCPKCKAPIVVIIELCEVHMGLTRYKPLKVFELDVWKGNDKLE